MTDALIELPWPPSSLSGHSDKHYRVMRPIIKRHREWAMLATIAAGISVTGTGDIRVSVTFMPPNRRGDRINFPNRMKPYFDGIADALKVNDSRFLPAYHFAEPVENGKVVVLVASTETHSSIHRPTGATPCSISPVGSIES